MRERAQERARETGEEDGNRMRHITCTGIAAVREQQRVLGR